MQRSCQRQSGTTSSAGSTCCGLTRWNARCPGTGRSSYGCRRPASTPLRRSSARGRWRSCSRRRSRPGRAATSPGSSEVGAGVGGFSPGDEVIGFSDKRASQAELVLVEAGDLARKPEKVSWEAAGGLFVAGTTAWGAIHAVQPKEGETVVISGAAGGVGSLAVQLARRTGATVIGLASENNHEWLKSHGVIPVEYGDGVADRIRAAAPSGVDAFIDTHGDGYVELALTLGVAAERIDTIVDFAAAQ